MATRLYRDQPTSLTMRNAGNYRRDRRLNKPSSSGPDSGSESSGPAAPDAIRASLSRRPGRPASDRGPREVDLAARTRLLKAMLFGGISGGFLGVVAGIFLGHPFLGGVVGVLFAGLGPFLVSEKVGGAARFVYAPSGRSTPPGRDYSRAEALAVRGHYDDAIAVYQEAIDEIPSDPQPYLSIARLLRDEAGDAENSAVWLRRALQETELRGRWEMILTRELTELYRHRIGAPARAAPLLAKLAEKYEGSPDGEWAREELADVKRLMLEDADDAQS